MTQAESIIQARDAFVATHGPWTGHRIHLGHEVYTCDANRVYCLEHRIPLHLQIMADFGFRDLTGHRILDLGCLEGAFSIEFARRGAWCQGIDARPTNIAHARFAAALIGLGKRAEFFEMDVRDFGELGKFTIVLCAGILYHLTADDAISVLQQIAAAGPVLTVIDTHTAPRELRQNRFNLSEMASVTVGDQMYRGRWYPEFPAGLTKRGKEVYSTGSAIDNEQSFWFTPSDLRRAVESVGFRVYEALQSEDRTVIAGVAL